MLSSARVNAHQIDKLKRKFDTHLPGALKRDPRNMVPIDLVCKWMGAGYSQLHPFFMDNYDYVFNFNCTKIGLTKNCKKGVWFACRYNGFLFKESDKTTHHSLIKNGFSPRMAVCRGHWVPGDTVMHTYGEFFFHNPTRNDKVLVFNLEDDRGHDIESYHHQQHRDVVITIHSYLKVECPDLYPTLSSRTTSNNTINTRIDLYPDAKYKFIIEINNEKQQIFILKRDGLGSKHYISLAEPDCLEQVKQVLLGT